MSDGINKGIPRRNVDDDVVTYQIYNFFFFHIL